MSRLRWVFYNKIQMTHILINSNEYNQGPSQGELGASGHAPPKKQFG
jgi:hypothetical protein